LVAALAALAGLVAGGHAIYRPFLRPVPAEAIRRFYDYGDRAEFQLEDPLIVAGPCVVPMVIEEVRRGDRPLRRYAIDFLGTAGDERARPLLLEILGSDAEQGYYRADALVALYQLDPSEGRRLAQVYTNEEGYFGYKARGLLERPSVHVPHHRTYLDALLGTGWP
jgi:hypothetical protein